MKKYDIMGHQMVKVSELRWVIRRLRKDVPINYKNFDKEKQAMVHLAYNDIVRHLYLEELKAAESPEEIEAILEMPGTFVVYQKGDKGRTDITFFSEFADGGKPVVTKKASRCMIFSYESKAQEVARSLGEDWKVMDASKEEYEANKRLLDAIFGDDDDMET